MTADAGRPPGADANTHGTDAAAAPRPAPPIVRLQVAADEGPVLDAVLARRIARAHGFQRTGSRIQERVEQIACQLFASTEESVGSFYWPRELAAGADVAFRWAVDDESARGVEEICEQELVWLARSALTEGKTGEDALLVMAREMGLARLRAASRSRLEVALAAAMRAR
jgi:hypothetical protein